MTSQSGPERAAGAGLRSGSLLRIAFFTDSFLPTHDGVAGTTAALAAELAARGHELSVFTVRLPGQKRRERLANGVTVYRHLSLPAPSYPQYRIALFPWPSFLSGGHRFDVVHVHTPGFVGLAGWLAARWWHVPKVATYHTNLTDMLRGAGTSRLSRAFYRGWGRFSVELCRSSDLATAPTVAAGAALRAPGRSHLHAPPRIVENGIDTTTFRPGIASPDWRARWGVEGVPLITFLGRLTRDKGVHRFLDAVERLGTATRWLAVVAGEGPERPSMEERLRPGTALSARAQYLGPVLEREKAALLAQTQIFVLPSLSDTSSVALLEAMASGAACVVTCRGGPGEIARESSAGLIVDPQDLGALTAAIELLLNDGILAREFSERGRAWVIARASVEKMATEFVNSYLAVLRAPKASPLSPEIRAKRE
ncbi:MAG TPA: glycosyltransferase [Thermoplasmata archaeon]|nr:glycosyltransferase [Thermoplasmata archaeon]